MKIIQALSLCKKLISFSHKGKNNNSFLVVKKREFVMFLRRCQEKGFGQITSEIYSDFYLVKQQDVQIPLAFARVIKTNSDGSRRMLYCIHSSQV